MYPVIEWKNDSVLMLDQRLLPQEEKIVEQRTLAEVAQSIRDMVIRGAPAIGIAAAMGIALGMKRLGEENEERLLGNTSFLTRQFAEMADTLRQTRPTAVNMAWALEKMKKVFDCYKNDYAMLSRRLIEAAIALDEEDFRLNKQMGLFGQELLADKMAVLTHCNAGALATAGYGTALGVIRAAREKGKDIAVFACETRPYLQGARLTVWELQRDGIPVTLITDNMAGWLMKKEMVQAVIVGADRIAANGDTANKIGTYSLAVLAQHHAIPFYVAAPTSTIDKSLASGAEIPIEERSREEVLRFRNQYIAAKHTATWHPAFDVTPAQLITAIITEKRILYPEFRQALSALPEVP